MSVKVPHPPQLECTLHEDRGFFFAVSLGLKNSTRHKAFAQQIFMGSVNPGRFRLRSSSFTFLLGSLGCRVEQGVP